MRSVAPLWTERWRVWAPALAFFALNLALLLLYRFAYAGRVAALEERFAGRRAEQVAVEERRRELDELVARADRSRTLLAEFYRERVASESARLTRVIAEVKELARRSGLNPSTISYPEQQLADYRLVKKSFVFGVEGTYQELRQFINLLEVSPTFLTLEQISLSDAGQATPTLRISLRLAAYFRLGEEGEEGTAPAPAAESGP